jgi:hypothetical protein
MIHVMLFPMLKVLYSYLIIIIIIITIICYHLYVGYLQLCTWNKPCF